MNIKVRISRWNWLDMQVALFNAGYRWANSLSHDITEKWCPYLLISTWNKELVMIYDKTVLDNYGGDLRELESTEDLPEIFDLNN